LAAVKRPRSVEGTTDLIFIHKSPFLFFSPSAPELSIIDLSTLPVIGQFDEPLPAPTRFGYRSIADLSISANQRSSDRFVLDTSFRLFIISNIDEGGELRVLFSSDLLPEFPVLCISR
jgi:hypothetical protein